MFIIIYYKREVSIPKKKPKGPKTRDQQDKTFFESQKK